MNAVKFPLVLLQAKAGVLEWLLLEPNNVTFPLVLLQAKAGGFKISCLTQDYEGVSISSPSGEGGGHPDI